MSVRIHATCVEIGGRGVLILGRSGAGKSDLALRLLDRAAALVSDDYTDLELVDGTLFASPPEALSGKLEVRGVGIIERTFQARVPVALAIDLDSEPERLPEPANRSWLGTAIPVVALNGLETSAPIKVEAALALHGLPLPCRS